MTAISIMRNPPFMRSIFYLSLISAAYMLADSPSPSPSPTAGEIEKLGKPTVSLALLTGAEFNRLRLSHPELAKKHTINSILDAFSTPDAVGKYGLNKKFSPKLLAENRVTIAAVLELNPAGEVRASRGLNELWAQITHGNQVLTDRRNAQTIASVFNAAAAAGSSVKKISTLAEAVQLVVKGVKGGPAFADTQFQVSLPPDGITTACNYLEYDPKNLQLRYNPDATISATTTPPMQPPDAVELTAHQLAAQPK
jgi:hypothetical protein